MLAASDAISRSLRRSLRAPLVRRRHRGVRPADVVIASYPRSGSTWLAIMIGELLGGKPLDEPGVNRAVPMLGRHRACPALLPDGGRLLRTHDRPVKPSPRAVYVVRDPRDVVVSYFHFQRSHRRAFDGSLEEFVRGFVRGTVDNYGRWDAHVRGWTSPRGKPAHVLRYRDLLAEPQRCLRDVLAFLGADVPDQEIGRVAEANSFEAMRAKEDRIRSARPDEERFVRRGVAGGWREFLSEEEAGLITRAFGDTMRRFGWIDP